MGVAPLVPELVERLHTLKELHERAAQFAGSVAYISQSQEQLTRETKELKSLLTQVHDMKVLCSFVIIIIIIPYFVDAKLSPE